MTKKIYGVDPNGKITSLMVRDAIVECFRQAHCADSGFDSQDKEVSHLYCRSIVEKAFKDSEGDFEQPTKESILRAIQKLVEFSKNFRDPSIIQRHQSEIMKLVSKL